jgi:predicted metallo-beta-lactamase superfamily hydrolase
MNELIEHFIIRSYPDELRSATSMTSITITPLAFESYGVRSMCTFVETPDIKILIDPGLSLGPRFALLPHPQEYKMRKQLRQKLKKVAEIADILVVTHYHQDHYTPFFNELVWIGSTVEDAEILYHNKRILAKNYRSKINVSQRRRGWFFWKKLSKEGIMCEAADNSTHTFGATNLIFSEPVSHGEEESPLGWVVMLQIERNGEKFLYTSDVQGPQSTFTMKIIKEWNPQIAIIGGPSLYLLGYKISKTSLENALRNSITLTKVMQRMVIDHHILRDSGWKEFLTPLFKAADANDCNVSTAAEFAGAKNNLLEYQRKHLYEIDPPNDEFLKWSKLSKEERRILPPPV